MATDTIEVGDHRYLGGDINKPITIVGQPYQGCWNYIDGHHQIKSVKLSAFLPLPGDMTPRVKTGKVFR